MKKLLTALFLSLTLFTGVTYAEDKPSPLTSQQAIERLQSGEPVYSCSMKTDWFSDQPGQCPCCTMDLEKVKAIKDGKAMFDDHNMQTMEKK